MKAACESNKATAEQPKHPYVADLNSVSWERCTAWLSSILAMQQHPHPAPETGTSLHPDPKLPRAAECHNTPLLG